jgi:hypothetical protein
VHSHEVRQGPRKKVTVYGTSSQVWDWTRTGQRWGNRSAGSFLASMGDYTVKHIEKMENTAYAISRRLDRRRERASFVRPSEAE